MIFNKNDIIKIARQIETYNISIGKGDDCCILFQSKNPVTNVNYIKLEKIINTNINQDILKVICEEKINVTEI